MSSVLESTGYRRLLYSASAVIFGVMGQAVARGWLAKDLTGSNAGLGGVMLAFGVSMLLVTPWGGVAADRFPKRTVLLVAVAMLFVSSLLVGIAVLADAIEYWMLVAASALQAAAFALYLPARISFIVEVVEPEQIGPAVMLSQTAQEAMRVVAPALAGVLIGLSWFGVGGVFILGAATAALSAAVLASLPPGHGKELPSRSPVAEMLDAYHYVKSRRGLGLVALTTIGVVIIAFPYLTFLPTLADERYHVGAGGYGLMSGVAGLGAVVAGVVSPRLRAVTSRPWRTIAASGMALGFSLIALAAASFYWTALVALLAVGASGLVFQTTTQSQMLALSDVDYHGRMQSMVVLGFSGFGLAALPLGMLADAVTLEVTLALMGVVVLAVTGLFVLKRSQHRRELVGVEFA
ncbi:MAG: MFS transporter [Ilumatobacteraceae bacterium]